MDIGYSGLTGRVYLGRTNPKKPNEWIGEKKDITSEFIQVMLQKFEPNTQNTITVAGEPKYEITIKTLA